MQLRQSAHERAAGVIPKVECVCLCCLFSVANGRTDEVDFLRRTCSFVPASIPPVRRLQTLVVAIYELLMPIMYCIFFLLWYVPTILS